MLLPVNFLATTEKTKSNPEKKTQKIHNKSQLTQITKTITTHATIHQEQKVTTFWIITYNTYRAAAGMGITLA